MELLGWLLLFIGAGWLVYKYRRTDINQNEEESSSGLSPFAVFSIFLVIFVTMLIVMAAILYAWVQQGGPAMKMAPYGTMTVFEDDGVWDVTIIKMKIDSIKQWPEKFGFEQIRFKKYEDNGKDEFRQHVDVTDYNSARRFLVIFLYLNDNDGGETPFADYDIRVKPQAGKALLFPPLWTYQHTGEKPKNNPKYFVGSYLHYV